jgi:GTP-binding protein
MSSKSLVALVGRPNVGKSTLFNRIVGRRLAVVSEVPGTTRDRLYAEGEWAGVTFTIVDTGGIEVTEGRNTDPLSEDSERFLPLIRQQANIAIQDADIIVQVVDGQAGITAADREVAAILRQTKKPVIVAANKLESSKLWDTAYEFYELGLGDVFPVSSLHGSGTGDLLDAIVAAMPDESAEEEDDDSLKIAIMGRPNSGKSTLLNKLIGVERAIVSPIAGTTRDATDTTIIWQDQEITLIDTAGIRKRGKIEQGVEKYSVLRAIKALQRADIGLLLIDAEEGVTSQDAHIAGMLAESNAGIIVLVNKWDLIDKDSYTLFEFERQIRHDLNFISYAPIMFISAKSGQRVNLILPLAMDINETRYQRIATGTLNKFLRAATTQHPPPSKSGVRVKFFYLTQPGVAPPTFVFFVNKPQWVHFGYQRYLENRLRETFALTGTPIKLVFRARSEDRFG